MQTHRRRLIGKIIGFTLIGEAIALPLWALVSSDNSCPAPKAQSVLVIRYRDGSETIVPCQQQPPPNNEAPFPARFAAGVGIDSQ